LEKVIIARLIIRIVSACILNVFCYDFCEFLRDFGNLISESLYYRKAQGLGRILILQDFIK